MEARRAALRCALVGGVVLSFANGTLFHDGAGGGGRIYVRTSTAITPTATPAATVDTSLPSSIP